MTLIFQRYDPDSPAPPLLLAATSHDGGETFDRPVTINVMSSSEPDDMRTGALPAAAVDPVIGAIFVVWQDTRSRGDGFNDIQIVRSVDGGNSWTPPRVVNAHVADGGLDHLTPAVAAHDHRVSVTFLARNNVGGPSDTVWQRYTSSSDDGTTFDPAITLGPGIDLRYAATVFFDGTRFLGDYMGLAASPGVAHPMWCRSSNWPSGPAPKHQTTWSATVDLP